MASNNSNNNNNTAINLGTSLSDLPIYIPAAYSSSKLPTFQKIGPVVRIHFDASTIEKYDETTETNITIHVAREVVVPSYYTPEQVERAGVPHAIAKKFVPSSES